MSALIAASRAAAVGDLATIVRSSERERGEVTHMGRHELTTLRLLRRRHLPDEIGIARQQPHDVSVGWLWTRRGWIEVVTHRTDASRTTYYSSLIPASLMSGHPGTAHAHEFQNNNAIDLPVRITDLFRRHIDDRHGRRRFTRP
jgi:hypothetical protein